MMTSNNDRGVKRSMMESTDASACEEDVVLIGGNTQTSDSLRLSKFKWDDQEDATITNARRTAKPSSTEMVIEVGYSQVQTEVQEKGKAKVESEEEMESVLRQLEVENKERDEAQAELQTLQRTLRMVDGTPCNENTTPWLGWVHCLQDREIMISKAQHDLKKYTAESQASCKVVDTALQKFKSIIGEHGHGSTSVTIWSDVAEMMDCIDYVQMGKTNGIDWALEVAPEGWVPYNIFSSYFAES